jgi:bacteriorhodopsin
MIYESTLFSIIVQFITGLIDAYGITIPVDDNYTILKQILKVELGVQTIEFIFYIWLINSIASIKNITIFRYADWFITTPVMLITLMAFLEIKEEQPSDLSNFLSDNKNDVIEVVLLNAAMLLFGFLGELIPKYQYILVALGFIPFVAYFYKIYKNYLLPNKDNNEVHPVFTRSRIFWFFAIFWAFYGVAALFPYVWKNTSFNILDLFAKNGFGIILVYIIAHHRI